MPVPPDTGRVRLPDQWLQPGSLVATLDADTLLLGRDIAVETSEGILRFLRPVHGDTIRVRYEVVPLALPRIFQSVIPPDTAGAETRPIPPSRGKVRDLAPQARLDLRGSKTISLEIGSGQDLTVRQSLDVALTGSIAPGVEVRGVLSDRETPLQAEGRTTELSDLDRVFLQVDGPGAGMSLGDFEHSGPQGTFTAYGRQLEGVRLHGRRGEANLVVAAAAVPGEFVSLDFPGEEGKQGPYSLRPPGGSFDAVVLSGSERVWIDGERMVRGEDRDYVIDYAAATITFTGRRIVHSDSRITADYQIRSQPYRRNVYLAEAGWGGDPDRSRPGLAVRASLFSERDDVARPVGGPLTESEKQALREAGDSLTVDLASGIDCGEEGWGDYRWVEADSLPQPFLRHVGTGMGTCRVRFDFVGERKGEYADSLRAGEGVIYFFVGFRQGAYMPGRAVPRPARRDLLDLQGEWRSAGGLLLGVEAAGSVDDPNTLSDRDDEDRFGGALNLRLERPALPVEIGRRALGRWGFALESRDVGPFFRAQGRIDPGWYGYEWGIDPARLQRGDRRRSVAVRQEPGAGLALRGQYETISNRRDLEGARYRIGAVRSGTIHGSLDHLRAETTDRAGEAAIAGTRAIDELRAGIAPARASADVRLRRERTERGGGAAIGGSGFDEWEIGGSLEILPSGGRVGVTRTERQDRVAAPGGWISGDRARTWTARGRWAPPGRVVEAQWTRRDRFREEGDLRTDLANLLWSENAGSGWFGHQARADLATTLEERRIKSIEYVGTGRGRYDSLGVYVGEGDYDLLLVPTGESELQRRFELTWRVDLAPGRGAGGDGGPALLPRLWRTSQWLLLASFSSRTDGSAGAFWTDLPDLLLARHGTAPLASHRIRADGSALPRARWASPRIRATRERSRENLFENVATDRARDLLSLTLRSLPADGWTMEQEVEWDREEEGTTLAEAGRRGSLGWRSVQVRSETWFRPDSRWTLRLAGTARSRERIPGGERYTVSQLLPGVLFRPGGRSRCDLRVTRSWVDGPGGSPFGLERPGWEGRADLTLRLHEALDGALTGRLLAPDGGKSATDLRAEVRALF